MLRALTLMLLVSLLTSCGGGFDTDNFAADQTTAEMAFFRMSKHGALEPVLEVGQTFEDWQFTVTERVMAIGMSIESAETYTLLADRSGIQYRLRDAAVDSDVRKMLDAGAYGYASGKVIGLDRDLAAGIMKADIVLTEWRAME